MFSRKALGKTSGCPATPITGCEKPLKKDFRVSGIPVCSPLPPFIDGRWSLDMATKQQGGFYLTTRGNCLDVQPKEKVLGLSMVPFLN